MSDIAIRVENLSKQYRIGQREAAYKTLRESIMNLFGKRDGNPETIWALKDVSFRVKRGEVVGIIGRNGAGKSTLLKILSRVTEPTEGHAFINGRVGSLLEVGTGFHPELTGRENIFLNGAILGMRKAEIERKFDEIVAFAEIEKFIDTPVKRYSSGMYVRLAFAVAAHLEPEILLVDEVLAVGDTAFQRKCLGKMGDVAKGGKTVLYVSHNMPSILRLCHRAILLQNGKIAEEGAPITVVNNYIQAGAEKSSEVFWAPENSPGDDNAKIIAVRILNNDGEVSGEYYLSESITLEMEFSCLRSGLRLSPSFHVYSSRGDCVFATAPHEDEEWGKKEYICGIYRSRCVIPGRLLNEGEYRVSAFVVRDLSNILVHQDEIISFHVSDDGAGRGGYMGGWIGVVRPSLPWTIELLKDEIS